MKEVELYNAYRMLSLFLYIGGGLFLLAAVFFLVRSAGGVKEIRNRLTPKPVLKQTENNEEEQEHLQKVAEALQQGKTVSAEAPGTAATAKLGEKNDAPVTTVLSTEIPETKFRVVRKLIITHER